jgi:hypothetical protein
MGNTIPVDEHDIQGVSTVLHSSDDKTIWAVTVSAPGCETTLSVFGSEHSARASFHAEIMEQENWGFSLCSA